MWGISNIFSFDRNAVLVANVAESRDGSSFTREGRKRVCFEVAGRQAESAGNASYYEDGDKRQIRAVQRKTE